jgi:hypothetical protein
LCKLEAELEKIRIELKSSQKIVELLQEDIKLISHNLTSRIDGSYTQPDEHLVGKQ